VKQIIQVALDQRSYVVDIGQGLLAEAGALIRPLMKRPRVAIIADSTAWALHGAVFSKSLTEAQIHWDLIEVAPGEGSKSFASLERVTEALLKLNLERSDLIIAFGGGVTGDLTGFAAGITKRGIDFVQVPTTLLAQVDSSVGGKTAINASAGKNLIGVFWQPRYVLADLSTLATLPDRDLRAGWAEILKIGLLGDRAFFDWCLTHAATALAGNVDHLAYAIGQSVQTKARIVAEDEREAGVRALLNLGHTFGHAFEAIVGFDESVLRHGEAVACGMAMAFRFSHAQGLCPPEDVALAEQAIAAAGLAHLPSLLPGGPWQAEALFEAMSHDKKNENGALTLILTRGIGAAFVQKGVDAEAVRAFLKEDVQK